MLLSQSPVLWCTSCSQLAIYGRTRWSDAPAFCPQAIGIGSTKLSTPTFVAAGAYNLPAKAVVTSASYCADFTATVGPAIKSLQWNITERLYKPVRTPESLYPSPRSSLSPDSKLLHCQAPRLQPLQHVQLVSDTYVALVRRRHPAPKQM